MASDERGYMTREECLGRVGPISKIVRNIEKQNGKIEAALNGDFGLVAVIKEMQKEQKEIKKDIAYVKNNHNNPGKLQGRDKAFVYAALIGAVVSVIGFLITRLPI